MIGDIFEESLTKMRYAEPQTDGNRARWPDLRCKLSQRPRSRTKRQFARQRRKSTFAIRLSYVTGVGTRNHAAQVTQ